MSTGELTQISSRTARVTAPDDASLAAWNPPLSGEIAIRIRRDGVWEHDGRPISREALWKLFAGLLRRENDGHYYLLTPVEKWRIDVESHALLVVDIDAGDRDTPLIATLNTGKRLAIGGEQVLHLPPESAEPWLTLPNGLSARLTRVAWNRLVSMATRDGDRYVLYSAAETITLGPVC